MADAVLDECGILGERGLVDRVRGQEHHDELRRGLELRLVGLRGELCDVLARLFGVARGMDFALAVVRSLERGEVSVKRNLGVHDDHLAARQPDEHVGPQDAVLPRQRVLLNEVAVLDHPRHLDDVAQLKLAPRAARRRAAQGGDEAAGLIAQVADAPAERGDHLGELALRFAALALQPADFVLHSGQALLHRHDEPFDLLRAQLHLAAGTLLVEPARLLHARGERVARLRERALGDGL